MVNGVNAVSCSPSSFYRIENSSAHGEARTDIRIVFTGIDMPGSMDGVRLATAIRDRWPPIELILTSGKINLPKPWLPERGQFLSKPYQADTLLSAGRSFGP